MAGGMMSDTPDRIRSRVRDWLVQRLGAAGAEVPLPDPAGWSDWDAQTRR